MEENIMFQVSTLQALVLGYTRKVMTVEELLHHGTIGLGTFEGVGGEMIVADGHCYCATNDGSVTEAANDTGVPFAAVTKLSEGRKISLDNVPNIDEVKKRLDLAIEEDFGLNSMHVVRIDGSFRSVSARSEKEFKAHHVSLKEILDKSQKDFFFREAEGTLVCVYFPDYMDGINAAGWHLHFISKDRTKGGHVFDVDIKESTAVINKISRLEMQLPTEPAFDTYALKSASGDEIKQVEQGKK
ncbi:MAG: acetolactate decarboxylase [Lachnospiraceae bacterium]|nr:acetolactate decarboxylase [Lachnospiraceae bacterium]